MLSRYLPIIKNNDFNYSKLHVYQVHKRTVPSISVWHTIFFVIRNIHCFIAERWILNANDSIHEGLSKQKCLVCDSTREKKIERKRSNANACFVIANIAQTCAFILLVFVHTYPIRRWIMVFHSITCSKMFVLFFLCLWIVGGIELIMKYKKLK